ncbi:peptide ABC transporter substrate-binding protein [Crossiella cryophila]|uniref:Oligopeptide transport system substrate-binding protein n=1 Tax=Crossiella cryophila TaxID=43355 RepID=A0A7W7C461_9PSEU|nr:ABC transporter substrate-binding protein [Crossiella cryophila]MBB4674159.1 oligopeptide transport system substrate-binding protein [Crossiella cryophila]
MRKGRALSLIALPIAASLVLTACGGGGGSQSGGNENTEVSIFGTEPENPLVPGNTTETGGGKVVQAIFTGLVKYSNSFEVKNAMAESIELTKPDQYTIKLKQGWKFHDGTDVKAKNFVDAWNYTAYSPNGQQSASFFEQIKGFRDVNTVDPDGANGPQKAPEPKAKEMSGLKAVDDYTITVDFTEPHVIFKVKLGYSAYMPLPDAFFKDAKAFEAKPIGNGPFKFVSRTPKQDIKLERYEEYKGDDKPKIKKVKVAIYTGTEAAYAAVKGNQLDFLDTIPPSGLAGNLWKTDLKGRSQSFQGLSVQILNFPVYDKKYQNADFRKAISMAINRKEITEKIFEGSRKPTDGYAVDGVTGWSPGGCGELCQHNPTEAKRLFDKSGFTGKLEITSNADGGHKEWIEAACGQIKAALSLECTFAPVATFGEIRKKINAHEMTQVYRGGWLADYPSVENFLNPLYRTGGSSNDGGYSSPAVDAKLAEADRAGTEAESYKLYHEAEKLIANDMPAIPLWSTPSQAGWSNRLKNATMSAYRELDLSTVEVA